MPNHHERKALPYSAAQMYELVTDVRRYAEFLPWVAAVRVRSDSETEMLADLVVGFMALKETFSSRVVKTPKSKVMVDYLDGPMRHLNNIWLFEETPDGCIVDFTVDFAFQNRIFEALAGQYFSTALRKMTDAFVARAGELYGDDPDISVGN
jgi:coenzyme Q-binding protein COQ10